MEDKMLRQLSWIKWLLVVVVTGFLISNVITGWYLWKMFPAMGTALCESGTAQSVDGFQEQGNVLLLKGKEQEVLSLAADREADFPKDPYVFLYRGRAQFQLGEYAKAIETFNLAADLSPSWQDQYITPYVSEAKRRLSAKKASPDAAEQNEPLPTAMETYEIQVKKATEQQRKTDQLLTIQEEQVRRFGKVLDKWEQQTGLKKP